MNRGDYLAELTIDGTLELIDLRFRQFFDDNKRLLMHDVVLIDCYNVSQVFADSIFRVIQEKFSLSECLLFPFGLL